MHYYGGVEWFKIAKSGSKWFKFLKSKQRR
jgi:hypothetical protein